MSIQIDPANITTDSIPYVLGVIVSKIDDIKEDQETFHNEIKDYQEKTNAVLEEHEKCLRFFRFSQCELLPWISRNRYVLTLIFLALSLWISSLDWVNRYLQWSLFPPISGRP